jgi:hypothetical protein
MLLDVGWVNWSAHSRPKWAGLNMHCLSSKGSEWAGGRSQCEFGIEMKFQFAVEA